MTSRGFDIVINNPTDEDYRELADLYKHHSVVHYSAQTERGSANGTFHIQASVELKNAQRATFCTKRLTRGSVRLRKKTPLQLYDYCLKHGRNLKPEDRDFRIHSDKKPAETRGQRSDLVNIRDEIVEGKSLIDIALDNPSDYIRYTRGIESLYNMVQRQRAKRRSKAHVIILYGKTGSRKTGYIKQFYPDAYWADVGTNGNTWFTGYTNEKVIVLDDFYGSGMKYRSLLRMCDDTPYMLPVHGGAVACTTSIFIFTSNQSPHKWYKNFHMDAFFRRCTEVLCCDHFDWRTWRNIVPSELAALTPHSG